MLYPSQGEGHSWIGNKTYKFTCILGLRSDVYRLSAQTNMTRFTHMPDNKPEIDSQSKYETSHQKNILHRPIGPWRHILRDTIST